MSYIYLLIDQVNKKYQGELIRPMSKQISLSITVIIIICILAIGTFVSFKYYERGEKIKEQIPFLIEGESINYFDLEGMDASSVDAVSLRNGKKLKLFFIFSRPCSVCNKNILYWNKMAELLQNKADCYGIVLDNLTEAYNLKEKANLKFDVYVPKDVDRFIKQMKLHLNYPQTIVYTGKVEFTGLGPLRPEDATRIINMAKALGE